MAKVKCPRCAEAIQHEARVCRHCGHELTDLEIRQRQPDRIGFWAKIGLVALVLLAMARCVADAPDRAPSGPPSPMGANDPLNPKQDSRIRFDRFMWESHGDRFCKASAKVTNTGDEAIPYARVTLQFTRKGGLIGSQSAYLDVTDLRPGESSTWDAIYDCPGADADAEVLASSRGRPVIVTYATG